MIVTLRNNNPEHSAYWQGAAEKFGMHFIRVLIMRV